MPDPSQEGLVGNQSPDLFLSAALIELARCLEQEKDIDLLLKRALTIVLQHGHFDLGAVHLLAHRNNELYLAASACQNPDIKIDPEVLRDKIVRQVLNEKKVFSTGGDLHSPGLTEAARQSGYCARLCLPLNAYGMPQGVLDLFSAQPRAFLPGEIEMMEILAVNLAVMVIAGQLHFRSQVADPPLIRLSEFSSLILASESYQQALDLTVRYVLEATQAQSAYIQLLDREGKLILRYGLDNQGSVLQEEPMPRTEGVTRIVQLTAQPYVITGYEPDANELIHPYLKQLGVKAVIGLPLKRGTDIPIGILYVRYTSPHLFSDYEVQGLALYAIQATGAIEYLRLLEESHKREVDLGVMVDNAHLLISTLDLDDLIRQIAIRLAWVTGMNSCAISSFHRDPDHVLLLAQYTALGERQDYYMDRRFFLENYPSTRRVMETNQALCIRSEDLYADPAEVDLLMREGVNTLLMLPLWAGGQPIGLVELYSERLDLSFNEADLRRLRALSEQVAIALVNARHYQEEQRARHTAETLRKATAVLNTTLDLQQVLHLILEQLKEVVFYDSASLMLLEGRDYHVVAVNSHPYPGEALAVHKPLSEDELTSQVVQTREWIILPDAQKDPRFRFFGHADYVRAWMGIPLLTRNEVIGLLTLDNRKPDAYTAEDANLAMAFANQAALAVTNARLYQSERDNRTLAEALEEISLALSSSLRGGATLEVLLEQVERVVPYDSSCVMVVEGSQARIACHRGYDRFGISPDEMKNLALEINEVPNLKYMALTLQPHFIPDVSQEPGWLVSSASAHIKSWAGVPLVVRSQLLGFLMLDKVEAGFYTRQHAARLEVLSRHAALALNNAQTFGGLEQESNTDYMTGAYNYRFFQQRLRFEWDQSVRLGYPLSLLMVDIDHFKMVNDRYGHLCGDQVLRFTVERLKENLRISDILTRYGGEEFAVILPQASLDGARLVAERMQSAMNSKPILVGDHEIQISVSVGISAYPAYAQDSQVLVAQADQAMYRAKDQGRNLICVFGDETPRT